MLNLILCLFLSLPIFAFPGVDDREGSQWYDEHIALIERTYFDMDQITCYGTHIILFSNGKIYDLEAIRRDDSGYYALTDDITELGDASVLKVFAQHEKNKSSLAK